jgi:hypothetical protein
LTEQNIYINFVSYLKTNKMSEIENEVVEVEIYGYTNDKGQKVFTPNLEFAKIMANKYGTYEVITEKN